VGPEYAGGALTILAVLLFGRLAARYATGNGTVALPATAILASGTRP
jgi:hypothetical protein